MLRNVTRFFTRTSDNILDGSKIGILVRERHHYTLKQFLVRAGMIASTAVAGYLGYTLNNEEKTHCSNTTLSIALATLTFTVTHTAALWPVIVKRRGMQAAAENKILEIHQLLENSPQEFVEKIKTRVLETIAAIVKLSLADHKLDHATQTLGMRKRLLNEVCETLKTFNAEFWQRPVAQIIESLQTPNQIQSANNYQYRRM